MSRISSNAAARRVPAARRAPAAAALALALLSSAACGAPEPEPPPPLTAGEEARATELGSRAAAELQGTLAPRLMQAMQEGGPAAAARFCAGAADSLTAAAASSTGLEVKRTSSRIRNPANAPDPWEVEALRHFEAYAQRGDSLPPGWTQAVSREEMRFYAPLQVLPLCVQCHGDREALAPGVTGLLAEAYPGDQATGYQVGDLRGVVRVSIPRQGEEGSPSTGG